MANNPKEMCSTSLAFREKQIKIKIITRYCYTLKHGKNCKVITAERQNPGNEAEQVKPYLRCADGMAIWYSHFKKLLGSFLQS